MFCKIIMSTLIQRCPTTQWVGTTHRRGQGPTSSTLAPCRQDPCPPLYSMHAWASVSSPTPQPLPPNSWSELPHCSTAVCTSLPCSMARKWKPSSSRGGRGGSPETLPAVARMMKGTAVKGTWGPKINSLWSASTIWTALYSFIGWIKSYFKNS